MRQDVSANRLAAIGTSKKSVGAGVGLDLVRLPRSSALSCIIQLLFRRNGRREGITIKTQTLNSSAMWVNFDKN